MGNEIEAPVEFPDAALEPDEGALSMEQFAQRLEAKREQAAQDAGWTVPPGLADDTEPLDEESVEEPDEEEEAPDDEEAAEEAEQEPEAEQEGELQDEFYVGRYKSKDAAEAALREKDETIDRLFREVHEQRQQIEVALQQEAEPGQLDVPAWQDWAVEAVEQGAAADGAVTALRTGGQLGYNIYLRAWMDNDEQRGDALAFNNQVMLELAEQRARMAIEPFTIDMAQKNAAAEAVAAKDRVTELYSDFGEYKEEMDRLIEEDGLIPEETKIWLADVARTGFEGKVRAWEYLYMAASRNRAPSKQKAAVAEQKRRRSSADSAKVAATVSTSEGSVSRTPPPAAEQAVLQRRNELRKEWGLPLLEE